MSKEVRRVLGLHNADEHIKRIKEPTPNAANMCLSLPRNGTTRFVSVPLDGQPRPMQNYVPATHQFRFDAKSPGGKFYAVIVDNCVLYAFGGILGQMLLPQPNAKWTPVYKPTLMHRTEAAAAIIDDEVYIVGGTDEKGQHIAFVERWMTYDTKRIARLAEMQVPRSGHCLIVVENWIFAIGGYNSNGRLVSVEKHNTASNHAQWYQMPPMKTARSHFGAAYIFGKIYVCGGLGPGNLAEMYDIDKQAWTAIAPMAAARSHFSAVVYHFEVWAIGGLNKETSIEAYDPEANRWKTVENGTIENLVPGGTSTVMLHY